MSQASAVSPLPVIDLSLFDAGGAWRDHVAAQLDWAAGELGFFYVVGHGIEPAVIHSLTRLGRAFFETDARRGRGLAFDHDELTGEVLPWGRDAFPPLPGFADAVMDYMTALTGLGHKLMTSIGRGLKLGDNYFVDRYTGSPSTSFLILDHPPAAADGRPGPIVEQGSDGLLALLLQDDSGALQVKRGAQWREVPPLPGSFVVSVGSALAWLTSDRYTSPSFRFANRSARPGISIPFTFDRNRDAALRLIPADATDWRSPESRTVGRPHATQREISSALY